MSLEESLYEQLFALTTVMKQRVVDNFDGDTLNERWTQTNNTGVGTFAMADAVDEGFSVKTGVNSGDDSSLNFNNKRQYDPISCKILLAFRRVTAATSVNVGASNALLFASTHYMLARNSTGETNYDLVTSDSVSATVTASSVAIDTSFRSHQLEGKSSSVEYSIADILEATSTTRLPTVKLQPCLEIVSTSAGAKEIQIRYLEAFSI